MAREVEVRGLRELNRAFRLADKELAKGLRKELRQAAEPVARDAEQLALDRIANMRKGKARWSRMRTGATQTVVYVAPRERGRRTKQSPWLARPKLAPLLMDRAMQPALDRNVNDVVRSVDHLIGEISDRWGRF